VPDCRYAFAAGDGTSYLNECLLLREERKSRLLPQLPFLTDSVEEVREPNEAELASRGCEPF
jgi:hypothetical protein